jgi:hypothetical protein
MAEMDLARRFTLQAFPRARQFRHWHVVGAKRGPTETCGVRYLA